MKLIQKYKEITRFNRLWTGSFTYWWFISLATVLLFDIFWMLQTTFSAMSYFDFWTVLLLSAFVLALPSLFLRDGLVQTLWLLIFDLLFIANLMYCRTYYNAIPLQSYTLVGNLADFKGSVADSFRWYFIFLPVLSICAFIFYFFSHSIKRKLPSVGRWAASVGFLVVLIFVCNIRHGGLKNKLASMSRDASFSSSIVSIYSLGGYLANDYFKKSNKLDEKDLDAVAGWLNVHENLTSDYWNDTIRMNRRHPRNLVIIFCESFESWPIGKEIEGKELTPNINRWLEDSNSFYAPKVVTQTGSGRSMDGQLLIMTGLLPMNNDVYSYNAVTNKFFSLSQAMEEAGGSSILFTCDKPYVWNQAMVAQAFGTDSLVHGRDFVIDEKTGHRPRVSDASLMRQTAQKLKEGTIWPEGSPKGIYMVTYSGHNPFQINEKLRKINLDGNYPRIAKDYMIAVNYTDAALPYLIDYLKTRDDWEDTMVVITGDHEGLADHRAEAVANKELESIVDPLQHTPLIILNSPVGGIYDKPLGQVDVYSTILDLMGWETFPWKGMGWSVLDPGHPGMALTMAGEIETDGEPTDQELETHLKEAKRVSDLILRFNLLKDYPEDIKP